MHNLILRPLSLEKLRDVFTTCPPVPLLPPMGDPQWARARTTPLAAKWFAPMYRSALENRDTPLPQFTDDLYTEFHRTGNRLAFEGVYFQRRNRLGNAAMSAVLLGEPARAESMAALAIDYLREIFAEVSWALPAHVPAISGKDPMVIDLFAGETANLMGETLTLFGSRISRDFRKEVYARLCHTIFENYVQHDAWFMTAKNNWNAVCHQGVLGAALALETDADLLAKMFDKMNHYLPAYLDGFTPDGGCSEGLGYWNYGFGWFCELNRQLELRTAGKLSLIEGDPRINTIAGFAAKMVLSNGMAVNFADCHAHAKPTPWLVTYLSERLQDPSVAVLARECWRLTVEDQPFTPTNMRGDVFNYCRSFLRAPQTVAPAGEFVPEDTYLPDLAIIISRAKTAGGHLIEFAAKGGHNDEHHNHNDIGSYLLNADGQPFIVEIGTPKYCKQFFGPQRYEFWATRSLGHSVPLIHGYEQPAGKQFAGHVVEELLTVQKAVFSLEATAAYPVQAEVKHYLRGFDFNKFTGALQVTDEIETRKPGAIETAIICGSQPTIANQIAILTTGKTSVRITPLPGSMIREVQPHTYSGSSANGDPVTVWRLVLMPTEPSNKVTLGYRVSVV